MKDRVHLALLVLVAGLIASVLVTGALKAAGF